MASNEKQPETVKVEKPSFLKTLSLPEFSEQLGMDEKDVLNKVSKGEIIAIQSGGKGKPITYRFLETEVKRYKDWVDELAAAAKREADEKEAEAAGRKVIEVYERHGESSEKIIAVNWSKDLAKLDFDAFIGSIGSFLKKDLAYLKKADIIHDGHVYAKYKKLSNLQFDPVIAISKDSKEKNQWFIAEIVFDFPEPIKCDIEIKPSETNK